MKVATVVFSNYMQWCWYI